MFSLFSLEIDWLGGVCDVMWKVGEVFWWKKLCNFARNFRNLSFGIFREVNFPFIHTIFHLNTSCLHTKQQSYCSELPLLIKHRKNKMGHAYAFDSSAFVIHVSCFIFFSPPNKRQVFHGTFHVKNRDKVCFHSFFLSSSLNVSSSTHSTFIFVCRPRTKAAFMSPKKTKWEKEKRKG